MFGNTAVTTKALAGLALAGLLLAGGAVLAQQATGGDAARIERFKAAVVEGVESRRKLSQVMNDTVFSYGELAYQEFETSKYLTDVLEKNGFSVERDIAGMPTAWVARWGSGRPVIAIGSDIDCLPKASQKPGVAYREPLVEGAPGHGSVRRHRGHRARRVRRRGSRQQVPLAHPRVGCDLPGDPCVQRRRRHARRRQGLAGR